jgi:hypothetical protein
MTGREAGRPAAAPAREIAGGHGYVYDLAGEVRRPAEGLARPVDVLAGTGSRRPSWSSWRPSWAASGGSARVRRAVT